MNAKTEDQLVAEFQQACADAAACLLTLERAEDALLEARRAEDEAYFALEDFRAEQTQNRAITDAGDGE